MPLIDHLKSEQAKQEYWKRKELMPRLPDRWDFHEATKSLPLAREVKARLQVAMSGMDRAKLKENLDIVNTMRYDALRAGRMKMAQYCKAIHEFGTKYLESLTWQKKI